MAKIALIVGSVRRDRQGIKVARWMEEKLRILILIVLFSQILPGHLQCID